jgi:hypothetical protein
MALVHGDLYTALREAGVSAELATKAAEVRGGPTSSIGSFLSTLNPVVILLTLNLVLTFCIFAKLMG